LVFWLNVPIGVIATVLSLGLLPESHGAAERLDLVGVTLVTAGVVALVWALTRANDVGWSSLETISTLAVGVGLLIAFVGWESRVTGPMVPLRLFAVREFAVGNLTTLLMSGATFFWVAARGSLTTSWVELALALLVAGIGISMALPTVPTAVLSTVSPEEMGKASGINYMAQRFGSAIAIAIAGAVFSANGHLGTPASVTAGFRPALWACAGFALLAALAAVGIPSAKKPRGARVETTPEVQVAA
jgi:MFS family permease